MKASHPDVRASFSVAVPGGSEGDYLMLLPAMVLLSLLNKIMYNGNSIYMVVTISPFSTKLNQGIRLMGKSNIL